MLERDILLDAPKAEVGRSNRPGCARFFWGRYSDSAGSVPYPRLLLAARGLVAERVADLGDHDDPKENKAEGDQLRCHIFKRRPPVPVVRRAQRP